MYDNVDIKNILSNTEDCPESIGDKICKQVKKGKTSFSTENINTYSSVSYLLNKDGLQDNTVSLLVDILQDICDECKQPSLVIAPEPDQDCVEDNIITEDGICMITEDGDNIIIE